MVGKIELNILHKTQFTFMKQKYACITILLLFSYTLMCSQSFCQTPSDTSKFSWNVLFKPGTSISKQHSVINKLNNSITSYYNNHKLGDHANFQPFWCPCDSALYKLGFTPISGSGGSVSTAPPPPPPTGSGDMASVLAISYNISLGDKLKGINVLQQYGRDTVAIRNIGIDAKKILAIIDSGIDSTLFSVKERNLIWTDPFKRTIYNFLPAGNLKDKFDETIEKHGSAVTAIAIKAMDNAPHYPKLMILKALNKNNQGSIFSVSCALSYAIQKNATIVNLSLGYYGKRDPILQHYLQLCERPNSPIELFVAAGNIPGNRGNLCNINNGRNLLPKGFGFFYPACFTSNFSNITSVTQIRKENSPCFYQNYSNQFISLGLYDTLNCCSMQVGFLGTLNTNFYEGSSFATPAAAGLRMSTILQSDNVGAANILWNNLILTDPTKKITIRGKYIKYASQR